MQYARHVQLIYQQFKRNIMEKETLSIMSNEICAFVKACRTVDVEYRFINSCSDGEYLTYEIRYNKPWRLFYLGKFFMLNKRKR